MYCLSCMAWRNGIVHSYYIILNFGIVLMSQVLSWLASWHLFLGCDWRKDRFHKSRDAFCKPLQPLPLPWSVGLEFFSLCPAGHPPCPVPAHPHLLAWGPGPPTVGGERVEAGQVAEWRLLVSSSSNTLCKIIICYFNVSVKLRAHLSPFSLGKMFRKREGWSAQQSHQKQHSPGKAGGKSQGKWLFGLRDFIFRWECRFTAVDFCV